MSRTAEMPAGMKDLIARHLAAVDAANREAEERRERQRMTAWQRLSAFEDAVTEALKGNEWLDAYRVHNPHELSKSAFDLDHTGWLAVFDLSALGGHRLWLQLSLTEGPGGELRWASDSPRWSVVAPGHSVTASDIGEAVYLAAGAAAVG